MEHTIFFFVRFEIRYTLSLAGKILLIIVSPSRESVSLWIKITNILTSEDKTCVSVRVEDAMTHVTHSRKNLDSILSVSQWRCVRVSIYFPDSDGGSPLLRKAICYFNDFGRASEYLYPCPSSRWEGQRFNGSRVDLTLILWPEGARSMTCRHSRRIRFIIIIFPLSFSVIETS